MRTWKYATASVVAVAAAGAALAFPGAASASPSDDGPQALAGCKAAVEQAVWEDMDSFNKRDAARYAAIIDQNDMVTVGRHGEYITGYHANVDPVINGTFQLPFPYSMPWTVIETHVPNCQSGYSLLDAHFLEPTKNIDRHYTITITVAKDHGDWKVVKDTVTLVNPLAP